MDGSQFDRVTRALASPMSRRRILGGVVGSLPALLYGAGAASAKNDACKEYCKSFKRQAKKTCEASCQSFPYGCGDKERFNGIFGYPGSVRQCCPGLIEGGDTYGNGLCVPKGTSYCAESAGPVDPGVMFCFGLDTLRCERTSDGAACVPTTTQCDVEFSEPLVCS